MLGTISILDSTLGADLKRGRGASRPGAPAAGVVLSSSLDQATGHQFALRVITLQNNAMAPGLKSVPRSDPQCLGLFKIRLELVRRSAMLGPAGAPRPEPGAMGASLGGSVENKTLLAPAHSRC